MSTCAPGTGSYGFSCMMLLDHALLDCQLELDAEQEREGRAWWASIADELPGGPLRGLDIDSLPAKLRPVEVEEQAGDAGALWKATGWTPAHTFEQSVKDLVEAAI